MKVRLRNRSKYDWGIVLGLVIGVYLLVHLALPEMFTGFSRTYVSQPILWCLLAVGVLLVSRYGIPGRLRFSKSLLLIGLLLGAFHISCLVIAGVLEGFGHSPYAHTPYYVFLNLAFFGTAVVGIEFSRAYLLNAFGKRYPVVMMGVIALLFTAVMTPLTRLTDMGETLPYLGGTMLPLLAQNLLACLLAVLGGPLAAIAYMGALQAFEWFSPILPDLTWIIWAFVGTLAPVVGFLVLQSLQAEPEPKEAKVKTKKRSSLVGWVVTAIIAVVLIWVSFGALGFGPTVIVSGSMGPAMDVGDLAIVKEVSIGDIQEGDIIQYEDRGSTTLHRVVEIQNQSAPVFITKGDANDRPDLEPVHPEQITGKVSFVVPKIGWLPIGIKVLFNKIF